MISGAQTTPAAETYRAMLESVGRSAEAIAARDLAAHWPFVGSGTAVW